MDFWGNGKGEPVDVHRLLDSDVVHWLGVLVAAGAMVSFSTTRDRGALRVTVWWNDKSKPEYFRESEEAEEWLGRAAAAVLGHEVGPLPPPTRSEGAERAVRASRRSAGGAKASR
jgi:hypothetical protein